MSRVNPSMDLAAIVRVLERCPGLHGVPRPLLVHLAGFLVHEQLQPQQIVPSPAAG